MIIINCDGHIEHIPSNHYGAIAAERARKSMSKLFKKIGDTWLEEDLNKLGKMVYEKLYETK